MMGEWPIVRVGDLADSISETHGFGKDQLIFLNTSDILLGKILHQSFSAVTNLPGQAKKSIRRGDILFSEIRPANGRYAFVDIEADDYVVSTKLMVIRARNGCIVPRFLYQFLTSKKTTGWLQHLAESRSGTFPQITFDQVAELELAIPPKAHQVAIAAFLDTLDDKIELNRRMNETLEAMAMAIFKSWFVDFDPVRVKMEGRKPKGMDAATAQLFPDRFGESQIGELPCGWQTRSLYDAAEFVNGLAFRNDDFCDRDNGLPVVKIVELKNGLTDQTKYTDKDRDRSCRIDTGDLLYSWSGSPDTSLDVFVWTHGPGWLNQHIFKVNTACQAEKVCVYYLLRHLRPTLVEIARNKQTTGLGHVTVADMKRLMVAFPPPQVLFAFQQQVGALFESVYGNRLQNQVLTTIRDTLLPKLLSGEISTAQAEKAVT